MNIPREQRPSRLEDPENAREAIELVVQVHVTCATCGARSWIEYWNDEGRLVRRSPKTQPCWHYRANQLSLQAPDGDLTKTFEGGILKRERR